MAWPADDPIHHLFICLGGAGDTDLFFQRGGGEGKEGGSDGGVATEAKGRGRGEWEGGGGGGGREGRAGGGDGKGERGVHVNGSVESAEFEQQQQQ